VFHPGTLFQNETPADEAALPRRSFHREPPGFELKPARATFAVNPAHFFGFAFGMPAALRRLRRRTAMGWLDAYESYVMDFIARDRVDELRSAVEVTTARIEPTAPAAVVSDARHRATTGVALRPHALAKASR
jgi:hypothetical protein